MGKRRRVGVGAAFVEGIMKSGMTFFKIYRQHEGKPPIFINPEQIALIHSNVDGDLEIELSTSTVVVLGKADGDILLKQLAG